MTVIGQAMWLSGRIRNGTSAPNYTTCIGAQCEIIDDGSGSGALYQTAIGAGAQVKRNYSLVLGSTSPATNVGIGVSSPTASLQVVGNVNISSNTILPGATFYANGATSVINAVSISTITASTATINSARIDSITGSSMTLTYNVTAGSINVVGAGAGTLTLNEGPAPSAASGFDILWGDSTSNSLRFIPNNGASYLVVGSSVTPTTGNLAVWSSSGKLVDGGAITTSGTGGGVPTEFVLISANGTRWKFTVGTSGNLISTYVASGPSGAYAPRQLVLQDSSNNYWTLTVGNSGVLTTIAGGNYMTLTKQLLVNDSSGVSWVVSINTTGNVITN
jgi:hypothetical protein